MKLTKAERMFLVVCDQMDAPDFELTLEEFSVFYAAFRRAVLSGAPFDPGFVARVEEMNRDARGGMEDGDDDADVVDSENDDPHVDGSDADEIGGNLHTELTEPREANKSRTRARARSLQTK